MTQAQQRRQDLLQQTRKLYSDKGNVPAVHPRYGNFGMTVGTDKEEPDTVISTFRMRVIIATVLFLLYAGLDYSGTTLMDYSSQDVVTAVSKQIDVVEVWKSL